MNISPEFVNTVKSQVKDALADKSIELEAVYTGKYADIKRFNNLIKYYRKKNDQFKESRTTTLDISQKDTRVTIKGNNDITAFCNSGVLPQDVDIMKKKRIKSKNQNLHDVDDVFSFKLNKKHEEHMDREELMDIDKSDFEVKRESYFRLKKRISFKAIHDPFQIDMTIVREFEGNVDQVGKIANKDEKREIEIELIQPESESEVEVEVGQVTKGLINHMYTVLRILQNSSHVVGSKASSEVEKGYKALIGQLMKSEIRAETKLEQKHFLSYKPVTLELSHLDEKCTGAPGNIRENYAVTEKADGDRMALFIFDSKVYLVNDRFDGFKYTGIDHDDLKPLNNSLIDGEFIRQGKTERLDLFLGFDIYFHKNEDVRSKQFTGKNNRYELVKNTIDSITKCAPKSGCFEFRAKDFKVHKDIFFAIKDVLHFATYKCRYHTDGLIFQPTNLGCGDIYAGAQNNHTQDTLALTDKPLSTTWQRVYKWKPPFQNTIDFMIYIPEVSRKVATELRCELRVHNNYKNKNVVLKSILDVLNSDSSSRHDKHVVFAEQVFSIEDLDKVKSGEIWEFSFKNDETKNWKDQKNVTRKGSWQIHKRRDDKMGVLQKKNKDKRTPIDQYELGGSANAVKTANSVYSTIMHPITEDMIKSGEIPSAEMDSQYYVNTIDRDKLLMHHMNSFHNKVIKEQLITEFSDKTKHIVDVACGRGGDILKYKNYASVLGFDISFEGIFSDNDSAWTRYLDFKANNKRKHTRMMFLPQDMGKQLGSFSDPSDEQSLDEKNFQTISKYIMGDVNDIDERFTRPKIKHELDFFKDRVNEKFDVVNCQFALHYFFKDEGTLTTFCKNVDNLLKDGGHFIGTCFDGVEVNNKFESSEKNKKRIEGEISGNVVWRIDKGYDTFENQKCGLAIDVFVESIGQSRREYLVDMEYLQQKFKQVNPDIKLIKRYSFKSKFEEKFRIRKDGEEVTMKAQEEALKQYSGMNICFIFQKTKTK